MRQPNARWRYAERYELMVAAEMSAKFGYVTFSPPRRPLRRLFKNTTLSHADTDDANFSFSARRAIRDASA